MGSTYPPPLLGSGILDHTLLTVEDLLHKRTLHTLNDRI
jgi:hypothetical protein